ncbi:MAG: hypothetical protein HFF05_03725 [Oscillospiraceae bacterium]|nr:hypothetical protein [Oscillospiraceae bacterium]
MKNLPLQVQMLGEFSIRSDSSEVNDSDSRSKKVWLLLAYMIYCRNRSVSSEELVELIWGEEEGSSNPLNALKTMFHRARTFLNQLDDTAGHSLILRREGSYAWNTDVPLTLDIDRFDHLCHTGAATQDDNAKLEIWLEALPLYRGPFLSKLSSEPWVVPIAAYYQNLYIETILGVLPLLKQRERWQDVVQLCRTAIALEPYQEELYSNLMSALIRLEDQQGAVTVYEEMSQLFLSNFGIMPSDDLRALYREAVRTVNSHTVAPGEILEQLREESNQAGALFCDYDIFRVIYHSVARLVTRSGDAVHLALISVSAENGKTLARRSLDRVVGNLQELICSNLRRGDVAARCSLSQFILLLPQANFENSQMICSRIARSFVRQYPHSPAQLHFSVHPLEPSH